MILACIVCDTCLGLCVEFDTLVYYTEVVKQGVSCLFEGNFTVVFVFRSDRSQGL